MTFFVQVQRSTLAREGGGCVFLVVWGRMRRFMKKRSRNYVEGQYFMAVVFYENLEQYQEKQESRSEEIAVNILLRRAQCHQNSSISYFSQGASLTAIFLNHFPFTYYFTSPLYSCLRYIPIIKCCSALIINIFLMQRQQKQLREGQEQHLMIKSIIIRVKFACRCFLEYHNNEQLQRTKDIKVDSKSSHYEVNEVLRVKKVTASSPCRKSQEVRIAIKLLSNKGLSFTVGHLDINPQVISRSGMPFELKAVQTQDIEARCVFQYVRNQAVSGYNTPRRESVEGNILSSENLNELTNSSKSKNSKLEMEFQQLRDDYYQLKDKFSKYEGTNTVTNTQKQYLTECRTPDSRPERKSMWDEELRDRNKFLELRIAQLERELSRNNDLFNKQKEIVAIFESNLKDKSIEQEQLRSRNKQLALKNEELYKQNCSLQQQKIRLMMDQLKSQKQKCSLGEYMAHMFQQVYNTVDTIFKKKITNLTSLAQNKQVTRKEAKRASLTPNSNKLFHSSDFRKCHEPIDIIQDVSISGDLSASDINTLNNEPIMKNILKESQPKSNSIFTDQCIQSVKNYSIKIERTVNQSVQKLFKTIMELTSRNQQYKKQMTLEKEQFQNNEESLIYYLEQIEEGLETQLMIVKEREDQIARLQGIIDDLNEVLVDKESRIKSLEEAYEKLLDERDEVKAQLHENNYIYAVKEEQFLKKIYELQNGFQRPNNNNTQAPPKRSNIITRKPTIMSEIFEDQPQIDEVYQNQIVFEAPHLNQDMKQFEENQPEHNNFYQYQNSQEESALRYTMLKNHRDSLVKRLREQMESADNVKSISEDRSNSEEEKVIEQQFLRVLV